MEGSQGVKRRRREKNKNIHNTTNVWFGLKTITAAGGDGETAKDVREDVRYKSFHTESAVPVHTCSSAATIKQLNELLTEAGQEAAGDGGEDGRTGGGGEGGTTCISEADLRLKPCKQQHQDY